MNFDLNELPLLSGLAACGFVLSMLYDCLRLVRIRGGKAVTAIADVLFGLLFFARAAAAFLYLDRGRVRAYGIPVIMLAFLVWQYLPGRLIRTSLRAAAARIARRRKKI